MTHNRRPVIVDRMVTFDPVKDAQNIARRGLSFDMVEDFDWSTAIVEFDRRRDYGEERYIATGFIDGRLHVLLHASRRRLARDIVTQSQQEGACGLCPLSPTHI